MISCVGSEAQAQAHMQRWLCARRTAPNAGKLRAGAHLSQSRLPAAGSASAVRRVPGDARPSRDKPRRRHSCRFKSGPHFAEKGGALESDVVTPGPSPRRWESAGDVRGRAAASRKEAMASAADSGRVYGTTARREEGHVKGQKACECRLQQEMPALALSHLSGRPRM
ncbi:uncharacterized protein LOC124712193 [Schistocerca piceifrons]|uniref:uncharacterized protein LOC124712193 n=1 Tax=Schistocerca piceifrons TaxID=274613 RepID=UPI001F5E7D03|nr:uncharacterized protein LOC124712193 [Schistocerca piceifrons]